MDKEDPDRSEDEGDEEEEEEEEESPAKGKEKEEKKEKAPVTVNKNGAGKAKPTVGWTALLGLVEQGRLTFGVLLAQEKNGRLGRRKRRRK